MVTDFTDYIADRSAQRVPRKTIERLTSYRKVLEELHQANVEYVYSSVFAKKAGVTPAQLRKDLSIFGSFGNTSRGYNVGQLIYTISKLLGTNEEQNVVLIGFGHLGETLLNYPGLKERGFSVCAVFDVDPLKVGKVFAGRPCYHLDQLESVLPDHNVRFAILASRRTGLQDVVDRLANVGVRGFLNFVPRTVIPPNRTFLTEVDIAAKLEELSFLNRETIEPSPINFREE